MLRLYAQEEACERRMSLDIMPGQPCAPFSSTVIVAMPQTREAKTEDEHDDRISLMRTKGCDHTKHIFLATYEEKPDAPIPEKRPPNRLLSELFENGNTSCNSKDIGVYAMLC